MEYISIATSSWIVLCTEIVCAPKDTTIFVEHLAVFTCVVDGDAASWRVNGTLLNDLPPDTRSDLVLTTAIQDGNILVELSIPGRVEYNGTTLQCVTVKSGSGSEESGVVMLLIQGI